MTGQAETVILGIDPGLRHTGWGIVRAEGNRLAFIACGTVSTAGDAELARRLAQLHEGLVEVVETHNPEEAAVETTFVNRDPNATLKLGQARGVALLVPALAGIPVAEYAPNAIKKTVTGTGHGDKRQIMMMVQRLLPRAVVKGEHAADALAVAICHAHMRQSRQLHAQIAASGKG